MEIVEALLRILGIVLIAFTLGKIVSKIKMPAILGWLITGMIFGPHLVDLLTQNIMDNEAYKIGIHFFECAVGLMIGSELVFKKLKKYGKSIIITTLTQSIGTFLLVSLVFSTIFYFVNLPIYLGFVFGGIALATAPAPALSVVNEFNTDGPVTRTLIPMAALDDIVGVVIFFSVISIIGSIYSVNSIPIWITFLSILVPIAIGIILGVLAGLLLRLNLNKSLRLLTVIGFIIITTITCLCIDYFAFPVPLMNYMLLGMAFSSAFANMINNEKLEQILTDFKPILGISMIIVILNLGAPLDYHLIANAGIYTVVYIIVRALGKYFGAYFGSAITKSEKTVKKYLGLTLLPHSGVSLVFTGIAVSTIAPINPEAASVIQGTIAAAAVINEIIAVIIAKKGFEWAGEFNKKGALENQMIINQK